VLNENKSKTETAIQKTQLSTGDNHT